MEKALELTAPGREVLQFWENGGYPWDVFGQGLVRINLVRINGLYIYITYL